MTERVDFYILKNADPRQRRLFVCRLTEKALRRDLSVVVLAASEQEVRDLDELMWSFSDLAFVPHQPYAAAEPIDPITPVALVDRIGANMKADILVNMGHEVPTGLQQFSRIAEIVAGGEEELRQGRERFKIYREAKIMLETHQVESGAEPGQA